MAASTEFSTLGQTIAQGFVSMTAPVGRLFGDSLAEKDPSAGTSLDGVIITWLKACRSANQSNGLHKQNISSLATYSGRVGSETVKYFTSNPAARLASLVLIGSSLCLSQTTFLIATCTSLILAHNCRIVVSELQSTTQFWKQNEKLLSLGAIGTGLGLLFWGARAESGLSWATHSILSIVMATVAGGVVGHWFSSALFAECRPFGCEKKD